MSMYMYIHTHMHTYALSIAAEAVGMATRNLVMVGRESMATGDDLLRGQMPTACEQVISVLLHAHQRCAGLCTVSYVPNAIKCNVFYLIN